MRKTGSIFFKQCLNAMCGRASQNGNYLLSKCVGITARSGTRQVCQCSEGPVPNPLCWGGGEGCPPEKTWQWNRLPGQGQSNYTKSCFSSLRQRPKITHRPWYLRCGWQEALTLSVTKTLVWSYFGISLQLYSFWLKKENSDIIPTIKSTFEVYNSIVYHTYTNLCNHHQINLKTFLASTGRKPHIP